MSLRVFILLVCSFAFACSASKSSEPKSTTSTATTSPTKASAKSGVEKPKETLSIECAKNDPSQVCKQYAAFGVQGSIRVGRLEKEAITKTIEKNIHVIKTCAEKAYEKNQELKGDVVVAFLIGTDGNVDATRIDEESTIKDSMLHQCMEKSTKHFRFPKPIGNGITVLKYPFAFGEIK